MKRNENVLQEIHELPLSLLSLRLSFGRVQLIRDEKFDHESEGPSSIFRNARETLTFPGGKMPGTESTLPRSMNDGAVSARCRVAS